MEDIKAQSIREFLEPPFSGNKLVEQSNRYAHLFKILIKDKSRSSPEQIEFSYEKLNDWLKSENNAQQAAAVIAKAVEIIQQDEPSILSESHDLLHLSEMTTSLLDDQSRGVETDRATTFLGAAIILLHDLGRRTEKMLTNQQIDLTTNLHHDVLSFRAAGKIIRALSEVMTMPKDIRNGTSLLIMNGILHFGETGRQTYFAVAYDTDRRQLLGTPTVGRDIPYFGGMVGRDLSVNSIMKMPPGYTHYDSGGFFGQQNTMARSVFRDERIRELRKLNEVYDTLSIEAATIMLLACNGDEQMKQRAFDIDLGLQETPSQRFTDTAGRPWWPKKPLPSPDILAAAQQNQQQIESLIPQTQIILPHDFQKLIQAFVQSYSTIVDTENMAKVMDNIVNFSNEDRLRWTRILYFTHTKNQERYARRMQEFKKQKTGSTFLASITEPFIEIIANKQHQQEQLKQLFDQIVKRTSA